jgi:hypothetical protein
MLGAKHGFAVESGSTAPALQAGLVVHASVNCSSMKKEEIRAHR